MSFTPPECCGIITSDSEETSTSHSRLPWFITQIAFVIGSFSCRRKHRLADYKSSLARLQRCRSLWMYFFLLCLQHHSCRTPQTDIFRSFYMAVSRFKAFCLRALQTFAVSDHIRRFEVWSYCSPPPVCHCENVPLSRLLEVILGNSFQCRKSRTEVQVAEASWLAEKVDYHISGEGSLLVMSQDGCRGGVSHSLLEGCRDGEGSSTTGELFQQMCFPLRVHHRNVFTCRLGCDLECLGGSWQLPVGESRSTDLI